MRPIKDAFVLGPLASSNEYCLPKDGHVCFFKSYPLIVHDCSQNRHFFLATTPFLQRRSVGLLTRFRFSSKEVPFFFTGSSVALQKVRVNKPSDTDGIYTEIRLCARRKLQISMGFPPKPLILLSVLDKI